MKVETAIEELGFLSTAGAPKLRLEEIEAIRLGIEALKLLELYRTPSNVNMFLPLPGETKED